MTGSRADQVLGELRPGLAPEVLAQIEGLSEALKGAGAFAVMAWGAKV